MARKKKTEEKEFDLSNAVINEQPITRTLEVNYMPYTMSVIISRAIPEIDGFKPSHRKLLYTMYKMGLLTGARTKSANVVGATMKLNPHGDMAIYETLVRLTQGNEALPHPFIDSKGSFGKQYSKMAFAASRYTEVKLAPICREIFNGIDKDAVDMVDNYDSEMKEPTLLPTSFPNILISPNTGIAVGIASSICSFNLAEICDATCALIRGDKFDIYEILKAPDFSTGGELVYQRDQIEKVYETGRGSIKLRATWKYVKDGNCIEIDSIPYSTNIEAILDKIEMLVKSGRIRDINDVRDETDKSGLRITIDLKRGADPEKLMKKLFRLTPLEDDFSCNFNVLVAAVPRLMGVKEILTEWHYFRRECLKRELYFDLTKKNDKLHLLRGLEKILLDIDKAIKIIRNTENEREVIPNLCTGFGIDEIQAEFIADIKLRNLNKEYILNKTAEIESLVKEIEEIESILKSSKKLDNLIIKQLCEVKKKYGVERRTRIVYREDIEDDEPEVEEEYTAFAVATSEGYFKRIPMNSIRVSDDQKLKDGDSVAFAGELSSKNELLFFTDKAQVYKARLSDFEPTKASALGDYVPTKLGFEDGERVLFFTYDSDFEGSLFIVFENGKAVNLPMSGYKTKQNRKKLTGAYSANSPAVGMINIPKGEEREVFIKTHLGRAVVIRNTLVPTKTTRSSGGVQVIALKKNDRAEICRVVSRESTEYEKYKKIRIPTPGIVYNEIDVTENQTSFDM